MKARTAALAVAAALVIAAAALAYAQNTANTAQVAAEKSTVKHWWHGAKSGWTAAGRCGGWGANATLYAASRKLTMSGDGINVSLDVDVVNANATSPYGRVVYGTGTVQLGGNTYTAKSVYGAVGPRGARLTIYTGNALISLHYYNGQYRAVVKTLGQPGYATYNGTATLQIS
ncbi:hypothetical protein [Pyrobaculum ferrireducens]|uniref:Uncharacterized protein n=1 Tax=Pyrobaculum ferrireducens TaxID=1104324 RepID=G7VFZ2_9CREN|nr:hypothetical protein [Pyrobaculum ferrireducens]AET31799.1 hypothetical protein P186_0344 [Pyrobaculum ferrireducens]